MNEYKPLHERYKDQFDFYKNAHDALLAIPEDFRSLYHTQYLNELTIRLHELAELLNYSRINDNDEN